MNAVMQEHPSGSVLTAYSLGQLGEEDLAGIDGHLADCGVCRQVVEGVVPDTLLSLLRSAATEPDSTGNVAGVEVLRNPGEGLRGFGVPQPRPRDANDLPPAALANHPRYRVGELLGVGGMGAVYKAEHLLMERPVALKVLNRELIDKPATIERFRREVRAAARLTHPNIVAGFDAEQAGDVHFLVMEYVEGVSLARLIAEKGPLPVEQACDYIRQAALGLEHAHERGMVHRDIKPQNLMLTPAGQVKILDFGLARFVMESVPAGAMLGEEGATVSLSPEGLIQNGDCPRFESTAKPLTQIGIVMGTPDYVAPEQARDSHLADIRADIYSLGCTLYDLLAGHAPFPSGSAVQKVKAHLERTPRPLRDLRRDVPVELAKIIERMMAKDPAQRYQTPVEVAAVLTPYLAPPKPPRRKRWPALVAGFACAAALIAGIVIYVQTDNGTIVIETNDEKIAVMIEQAGGVKIVDQANQREYHLQVGAKDIPSGNYQIKVSEPLAGLEFQTNQFELKRGREVRLTARLATNGAGKIQLTERSVLTPTERKQVMARLESLRERATLVETMYRDGTVPFEQVLGAKREIAEAELDLSQTDKERIKIHERIVGLAQDVVSYRNAEFQAGKTPYAEVVKSKAELQKAQSDLERALARQAVDEKGAAIQGYKDDGTLYRGKPASYWVAQLNDADPITRRDAVGALGAIAKKDKTVILLLVEALSDSDARVAHQASSALAQLGREVVPRLIGVLTGNRSERMRYQALLAAARIGPDAKSMLPILCQELVELRNSFPKTTRTGLAAIDALACIGPEAKSALPTIAQVLGEYLPVFAQSYDQNQGPPEILEKIDAAVLALDPELKQVIAKSVRRTFGVGTPKEWQQEYDIIKKKYPPVSSPFPLDGSPSAGGAKTASSKSDEGPLFAGKPASFWLHQLQDTNAKYRAEAVKALGSIAEKNTELIPVLVGALKDKDFDVGHSASNALADLGPAALPGLLAALKDKSSPTGLLHAIIAVGYIGPKAKAAVPLLSETLTMDNVTFPQQGMSIWGSAIITLGRIGPEAKPAIPSMVDALGKYLKSVKQGLTGLDRLFPFGANSPPGALATALPKIDPELKDSLPSMESAKRGLFGNIEVPEAEWQKAYETLRKKYPPQMAAPSPDIQPKKVAPDVKKDQDALYRGKPASFWLNQLRDTNPEFRGDAVTALGNIAKKNKDLLPVLVEALKDENAGYIAAQFLHAAGPEVMPALLQVLKDKSSPTAVANAINALPSGPEAKVAVPYLTQQLKINDWKGSNVASTCISAVNVLGSIGPDAKPALPAMVDLLGEYLKTLTIPADANGALTNQTNVALFANREAFLVVLSDAFVKIDPEIGDMLPKYKKQNPIEKTEILVKRWQDAYEALNKKYPTQAAPVRYTPETGKSADSENPLYRGKPASFWLDQFKDSDPKFRAEAVDALGYFAKNNKERVPVLVAYLKDKDKSVAMKAAKVVGSLGPEVLPTLLELLQDKSSTTTLIRGTEAVGWIGSEAKPAVPLLIQELKMADWDLRRASITALSRIGPEAKSALPDMIEVLGIFVNSAAEQDKADMQERPAVKSSGNKPSFRVLIHSALTKIDPSIQDLLPKNRKVGPGMDPEGDIQQWQKAYESLKKRYPAPGGMGGIFGGVPFRRPGDEIDVRPSADVPLYRGKPASFWLGQFKDSDPKFRAEAVMALGSIAQKNKELIPVLVEALADKDYAVGSQVVAALGSLGPEIVPVILEVLKNPKSPTAFSNAAKVVGKIGAQAKDAVPFLERALKKDATDGPDQRAIILALGRIGPDAKPAIPALVETLGRYLESVKGSPKQGSNVPGIGTGPLASPNSWPRKVLEVVQQIDPDVKDVLPERINDGTLFMGGTQNWTQLKEMWDQTYAALKKRYPK